MNTTKICLVTLALFSTVCGCQKPAAAQQVAPIFADASAMSDAVQAIADAGSSHAMLENVDASAARSPADIDDAGANVVANGWTPLFETDPACPQVEGTEGMVLVEGEACKGVSHMCIRGTEKYWTGKMVKGFANKIVREMKDRSFNAGPHGRPLRWDDICEEFVPGSNKCSTKTVTDAQGNKSVVKDTTPMRFCMDRFEWPNKRAEMPQVWVTWDDAAAQCESIGKRLCDEPEWIFACEGPEALPYSYGYGRDSEACAIDKTWVDWQKLPSFDEHPEAWLAVDKREAIGNRMTCTSPFGAFDLLGNVDEWVVNKSPNATRVHEPFVSTFHGGHWAKGARNRCRPNTDSHEPNFRLYAEGFRCCAGASR